MIRSAEFIETDCFIAEVIRTGRSKSASIRVEDGAVSIVVPKGLSDECIQSVLIGKERLILQKIEKQRLAISPTDKEFISGEGISYLGRNYRLKLTVGAFKPAKLVEGQLLVTIPKGQDEAHKIRNAIIRWYKRQADSKLKAKVKRYAPLVGVSAGVVNVKSFKSRWGSCTVNGELEFNWRIMMAPNRIVDYVVVHELCHLIHHNHSPEFWSEVERVIPDFKADKQWLKDNAVQLMI